MGIYKVICTAAKNHGQNFSTSSIFLPTCGITNQIINPDAQMTIMQNLQYTEHLSEPMAELVTILAKEFDYSQLGEDVLRHGFFLSCSLLVYC